MNNWQSDPEGRIRNISLAPNPKNALFPLFEAVMNSIHAIEERFGKDNLSKGYIEIEVVYEADDCVGFRVKDNGIGFTPSNLESFMTMDSSAKKSIGGKGVGRLLWLKVIESVAVESTYGAADGTNSLSFDFSLSDPIGNMKRGSGGSAEGIGTTVKLAPYAQIYGREIPRKLKTIANRLLAHFISYFVNISHPKITIFDSRESVDLLDQFAASVERDKDYPFSLQLAGTDQQFTLHAFLLPKAISDDERSTNALYLGANGRAVKRLDMDNVIGMKAIDGKFAFLGYVESKFLDAAVNETRIDFSISEEDADAIIDASKERVKEFLGPEIKEIRCRQARVVKELRVEHPRFLSVVRDPDEFANALHLSTQGTEEIFVELSRRGLRTYERLKNDFRKSVRKQLPDIQAKAAQFVSGLRQESLSSLAEYVAKRKLVLETFEQSLKYTDKDFEKTEYEKVLHGIICPLKSTTDDLGYDDHNLWVVDDRLAFYSYFNSDIPMRQQLADPSNPNDRPDISVFDLGLGFQNDDPSMPITIIEFKRPQFDEYSLEKNPIMQVRKYVTEMRNAGEARRYDGTPLRVIDQKTPFMCHIIADITKSLRQIMKDLGPFHQRAGTQSYYRWDDSYNIFIEVSSFKDVLESAKARNRAFFERLGLV